MSRVKQELEEQKPWQQVKHDRHAPSHSRHQAGTPFRFAFAADGTPNFCILCILSRKAKWTERTRPVSKSQVLRSLDPEDGGQMRE